MLLSQNWDMKIPRASTLYLISGLTDYSLTMFIFTVTRHSAEVGATLFELGILGAAFSLTFAVTGPTAGRISDAWGRQRVVILGACIQIIVLTISSWVLASWSLGQSYSSLYFLSGIAGLAVGMIYPPVIALLTEGKSPALQEAKISQALFRFCIAWNLGMILGQTTAGWLFSINHALPLAVGAFPMMVVVGLALKRRESQSQNAETPVERSSSHLLTPPPARTFVYMGWTANLAGAFSVSTILYLFPHLTAQLGISAVVHGIMLAIHRMTVMLIYWLMYVVTFWRYRLSTSLLAHSFAIVGLCWLALGNTVPALTTGLILVSVLVGANYFASLFYSTTGFEDRRKGMASGMHMSSLGIGFGAGGILGGILGTWLGSRVPYYFCALVLGLSATAQITIYLFARRRWIQK